MSGYLTVANEAIAIARAEPAFAAAVLRLYMDADLRNWGPFDCADLWMMRTFELTKREVRDLLRRLARGGCMVVEYEGDPNTPRSIRILRPENSKKRLDRGANRIPDRGANRENNGPKPTIEDSEPRVGPRVEPRVGLREDTSSTSTSTPPPLDNTPPADAGAVPYWEPIPIKKPRKEPSGAFHGAIQTWDKAHLLTFGVSYPWVFHGRDADGARIKSWLKTARVSESTPELGLERLRAAFLAYFDAVKAGTAWPQGDPATTKRFSADIAKWLRTEASQAPVKTIEEAKHRWFGGS